jgi:hypothetical protein
VSTSRTIGGHAPGWLEGEAEACSSTSVPALQPVGTTRVPSARRSSRAGALARSSEWRGGVCPARRPERFLCGLSVSYRSVQAPASGHSRFSLTRPLDRP